MYGLHLTHGPIDELGGARLRRDTGCELSENVTMFYFVLPLTAYSPCSVSPSS